MELDWKFWTQFGVSIGGLVGVGWQIIIMRGQSAQVPSVRSAKRIAAERKLLKRMYVPVGIMAALIVVTWIPYWTGYWNSVPPSYITHWGVSPPGTAAVQMRLDDLKAINLSANISSLLKFKEKYKVGAIAFHSSGLTDVEDVEGLQKSSLYDIRDDGEFQLSMAIPIDDSFRDMISKFPGTTNYALIIVPVGKKMDDFSTQREAIKMGARILQTVSGPP